MPVEPAEIASQGGSEGSPLPISIDNLSELIQQEAKRQAEEFHKRLLDSDPQREEEEAKVREKEAKDRRAEEARRQAIEVARWRAEQAEREALEQARREEERRQRRGRGQSPSGGR